MAFRDQREENGWTMVPVAKLGYSSFKNGQRLGSPLGGSARTVGTEVKIMVLKIILPGFPTAFKIYKRVDTEVAKVELAILYAQIYKRLPKTHSQPFDPERQREKQPPNSSSIKVFSAPVTSTTIAN